MFGKRPKLPIDSAFEKPIDSSRNRTPEEYLTDLKKRMHIAHVLVKQHSDQARLKQKHNFDKKANASKIAVAD